MGWGVVIGMVMELMNDRWLLVKMMGLFSGMFLCFLMCGW